jgi:hypothetical protein
VPEERLREFGISKVMTVTSTYDHRVIQGAESGLFLARMEELLKGEDGFYDLIEESLQLTAESYRGQGGGGGQARGGGRPRRTGDAPTWPPPWRW